MDKMSIYNRLPVALQNIACGLEGARINRTRYGKDFWRLLAEYESRANWSYDQLAEYRDAKLRKMIKHCYETVPYYTRLFNEGGINPDSIKSLDDLKVLPLLTKSVVNKNPEDFVSTAIPKSKMVTMHTSGTTGSSFIFQTTQEAICEQWAVWWRYRRALGIEFGTKQAMFGTQRIVPVNQHKPPYWRYNKANHQTYFSAFHEKESTLEFYYSEINEKGLSWIHGYPSLITLLASYVVRNKLEFDRTIKYVTLGAENLLESQRAVMQEAFGVEPRQHYGTCEGVANFSERPDGQMYVDEDFSAVEFVGTGDRKTVVGTSLTNYAMPLLRWDLCDEVERGTERSGKRKICAIDGRKEDYITLPDGTRIGKLDHVFKDTRHIVEAQIYQHKDYSIEVFAVRTQDDMSVDEREAENRFSESFGVSVPIRFTYVDRVPRTESGKLRFVVSEIEQ
jgi:phenylacetate-CoA ligase